MLASFVCECKFSKGRIYRFKIGLIKTQNWWEGEINDYVYIELERYLEYEKNTFFISVVFGGVS